MEKLTLPHSSRIIGSEFSLSLGDKYVAPPQGNQHLVRFYVSSKNNSLEIAQKILGETKISIISK